LIAASAALPEVGSVAIDDDAPADGAADVAAADVAADEPEPAAGVLLELLQALTPKAAASARPSAYLTIMRLPR